MQYEINQNFDNLQELKKELSENNFIVSIEHGKLVLYCDTCKFEEAQRLAKKYNVMFTKKEITNHIIFY